MALRSHPSPILNWSRRSFMIAMGGASVAGRSARAAEERAVAVSHRAFGSVVTAIGGADVSVTIDPSLPIATMRMGDAPVSVAGRLLLKGEGPERRNYLDDARNAPKLGATVRDQLRTRWPDLGDVFSQRHKTWSHALIRDILRWTTDLGHAKLRGKRVRDPGGRIYVLEWAGAIVTSDGDDAPTSLSNAPSQPHAATPDAYREYIQALIDALR